MGTTTVQIDRVEAAARALLDDKVQAVRALARSRQQRDTARAAALVAERDDASAWAAALRAGWTADELRRVGLEAPATRLPGRPRGRRAGTLGDTRAQSVGSSATPSPEPLPDGVTS